MSVTMSIGGTDIPTFRDVSVNDDGMGSLAGTFEIPSSVSVNTGDIISIGWDSGGTATTGIIMRTTTTAGTTSGTFSTMWPSAASSTRVWSSGTTTWWPIIPEIELDAIDEKLIEEFLIDSFARGFAKEQAA